MKKRLWTQITFHAAPEYQDILVGQLATLGFNGFLQEDRALACFIDHSRWTPGTERDLKAMLRNLEREFPTLVTRFEKRTIQEQNWDARWEKRTGIVEATTRIVIKPSWSRLGSRRRGKIVLHIDPKMSFGTGHHETTRLSLVLLQEYVKSGFRVLDFGTGTGILAIAAVKLGARSAVAIDNDEWAVKNARENVRRNRVAKEIRVLEGDAQEIPDRLFDLIVSNIDMTTLSRTLARLHQKLKPNRVMILSGLLVSDLSQFRDLLSQQGLVPLDIISENEWAAIALTDVDASHRN